MIYNHSWVSCRFAKPHFAKPHFVSVELSSLASLELWLRVHRPSTRPSVVSALAKRGLTKRDWRNAMQPRTQYITEIIYRRHSSKPAFSSRAILPFQSR